MLLLNITWNNIIGLEIGSPLIPIPSKRINIPNYFRNNDLVRNYIVILLIINLDIIVSHFLA